VAITLANVSLDEGHTTVREKYEEVGGRNERRVTLSGVIAGQSDVAAIDSALDAILDAASVDDFSAVLSLRAGRRLFVRREGFEREVAGPKLLGAFELALLARDPFEESVAETSMSWTITATGATLPVTPTGNVYAKPSITLVATGSIVNPTFSDGTRVMSYNGVVAHGETLVFDGAAQHVILDGLDVTPYTTGIFPRLTPEGTTLTYTDDASSSHTAAVTVAFRDRWW
jgi:hypothetical protein